jgi:hypothetical protein
MAHACKSVPFIAFIYVGTYEEPKYTMRKPCNCFDCISLNAILDTSSGIAGFVTLQA